MFMFGLTTLKFMNSPKTEAEQTRLSVEEWVAEATRRFGSDARQWRFVCPCCGNVQRPEEFRPYKDQGASPETAYMNCIGRYDGHGNNSILSGEKPCNYTSGGLFNFNPLTVIMPDGKEIRVFAFDEQGTSL
jgi:hypothetical protein